MFYFITEKQAEQYKELREKADLRRKIKRSFKMSYSKEQAKKYSRKYYQDNKEVLLMKSRDYYQRNKARKQEYGRKYYYQNQEKMKENSRQHYYENVKPREFKAVMGSKPGKASVLPTQFVTEKMDKLVNGSTFRYPRGKEYYQIVVHWSKDYGQLKPKFYFNQLSNGTLRRVKLGTPVVVAKITYKAEDQVQK